MKKYGVNVFMYTREGKLEGTFVETTEGEKDKGVEDFAKGVAEVYMLGQMKKYDLNEYELDVEVKGLNMNIGNN